MLIFIKTVFDGLQSQPIGWGQPKKMLRTVDGPLLRVVTKAYHLHMFLSLANLNIQKSLKHSNTRRGKTQLSTRAPCSVRMQRAASHRQQHRTELSFASSCTWTNKYKSQFKHANRKRCERAQFSIQARCSVRTGRTHEGRVSKRLNTEFASSFSCTDKYIQNYVKIPILESILKNTVGYVLSESKQLRKKSDVHHYIGCIVS